MLLKSSTSMSLASFPMVTLLAPSLFRGSSSDISLTLWSSALVGEPFLLLDLSLTPELLLSLSEDSGALTLAFPGDLGPCLTVSSMPGFCS